MSLGDGGINELSGFRTTAGSAELIILAAGGGLSALLTSGTITAMVPYKVAGVNKLNDFALSFNGATAVTDTSGPIPAATMLILGGYTPGSPWAGGWFKDGMVLPRRMTNVELQTVTTP
jgi:hypothetical protein